MAIYLFASIAHAQVMPPNPTASDDITFRVVTPCAGGYAPTVDVSGQTITVTMEEPGGCLTMISTFDIPLGTLPPGTYTISVVFPDATAYNVVSSFAVSAVAVPLLGTPALAILVGALTLVATLRAR